MKQRRLKIFMLIVAALVITTSTVSASSNLEGLKQLFQGDKVPQDQQVTMPYKSVTDGKLIVTLEQVLASQNRIVFIYSVSGATKSAKRQLMDQAFRGQMTLYAPKNSGIRYIYMHQNELGQLKTKTKRYYSCSIIGLENPQAMPLSFGFNGMEDAEKYIEIAV